MSTPKRILIVTMEAAPARGGMDTIPRETARVLAGQGRQVTILAPRIDSFPLEAEKSPFEGGFRGMSPNNAVSSPDVGCGPSPACPSKPRRSRDRAARAAEGLPPPDNASSPISMVTFPGNRLGPLRLFPLLFTGLPLARRHDHVLAMDVAYGGVLGLLARVFFRTPYTAYAHACEYLRFQGVPVLASLIRRAFRHAERVAATSEFARGKLLEFGVPPERVVLSFPGARAPDPVPAEAIEAMRRRLGIDSGPVILSAGRLVPHERHVDLVHAFSRVLHEVPDAWLVIAGLGPEMPWISRLAFRLGIRDRVVLPGIVQEHRLERLYALCSVFALPCGEDSNGQVEGFSEAIIEASAHGKPVIGGRAGGVPEAVLDGETGLLIEPGDLDALCGALVSVLTDAALAERLGANGRARNARELSWHAFADAAFGILCADPPANREGSD